MAINTNLPRAGVPRVCIHLHEPRQVAADLAFGASCDVVVPFKCRVVAIVGYVWATGGSTPHTDIDLTVRKSDGTTNVNLCSAMAVVDSSTRVAGGVLATLATTEAALTIPAGQRLQLFIDIAGGSSPTADGIGAHVYVVPVE